MNTGGAGGQRRGSFGAGTGLAALGEWAGPIVLAIYAGILASLAISQNLTLLTGWYSASDHLKTTAIDGADLRVAALTFVGLGAIVALGMAVLPRLMGVVSATLSHSYGPLFATASLTAAVLASIVAAPFAIGSGVVAVLVGCLPLIAVGIGVRQMERDRPGRLDDLACRLFLFAITSDGEAEKAPDLDGDASKPKTYSEKISALLLPVTMAAAGLVTTSLALQFGFGLCALLWPMFAGAEQQLVLSTGRIAFALTALVAGLPFVRRTQGLSRRIKASLLKLASYIIAVAFLVTVVSMAVYALIAPATAASPFIRGVGYLYLALAILSNELLRFDVLWRENLEGLTNIRYGIRSRKFWIDNHKILSQYPQPADPKGYLFFHSLSDTYTIASTLLVMCRMRQLGWATVIIDQWPIPMQRTGASHVDRFFCIRLGNQRTMNFDWKIDWEAGKVEAAGMNFYHPIWEGLSRHFGRYRIKLSDTYDVNLRDEQAGVTEIFRDILQMADATLLTCFRVLNTVAGQGKPVRILGGSGQFVPNAVWNIFCREIGKDRDMHFIWVQQGYQTYYKDQAKLSDRISLQNMTRKWPYSNPYLPHKEDFEAWIARGQDVPAIVEEANRWTRTMRATPLDAMSTGARAAYERIGKHRQAGGQVVCALGKMVFDLSTPWEKGPAHNGMADWINHTVEVARRNPQTLYLIKPHPYEARPEIAGVVEQFFTDMIEQTVPDNVLILGHDWFNLYALFPLLDLGVMWNGTSGLELGLNGIPCVMCSDWGTVDYPVGLPAPKDRADYERMLSDPNSVTLDAGFKERCALLLKYTASDEVMIPYDYAARPLTNEPFGPPYWYMDQVKRFIRDGDPHIDAACRRVL